MAEATYYFPKGFLWGTATAAHQVEGDNVNNNWYAWEQEPDRIIHDQKSGLACDWWNGRWREDFDRAAETGQNAHRMSIEWSRIQPAPDRWDESALDRYLEIVRGLLERHITPMITLHHFTDPLWLAEEGGWENAEVVDHFAKFVSKVVEVLKDYVKLWCTINEPDVFTVNSYIMSVFPPGEKSLSTAVRVISNQVRAHAAAYSVIHDLQPEAQVGAVLQYRGFKPKNRRSPLDKAVSGLYSSFFNDSFPCAIRDGVLRLPLYRQNIPEVKGTQDFLGINYYTMEELAFNILNPGELFGRRSYRKGARLSDSGYIAVEPEGMFEAIKWGSQFNLPIYITENGVNDADDRLRPSYLAQHIHQMWRGVNYNWPVMGYFHWTLVDNFEWERGWTQRFGLWELDEETQARRKRPSADLFTEICHENGLSAEMVARYAPGVFTELFPN